MSFVKWLIEFKASPDAQVGWIKDINTSTGEIAMTRNALEALHFATKEEAEYILSDTAFGPWEHLLSRLYVCDHQFITDMPTDN